MKRVVSLLVVTLAVAWQAASFAQQASMPGYPAVGAAPIVTLLAPGAAPQTPLRYKIAAGQKGSMDMTMGMSMTINTGAQTMPMDLPGIKISAAIDVTNVAANGDITYNLAFTKMDVDAGANPAMASAFQAFTSGITALKGVAVVTNRGVTKSAKLDLSTITDPTLKQTLSQMSSSLENLSMPFPEEAVGVGGRWEVRHTMNTGGAVIFQKAEYTLASVNGPAVVMNVKVEQTAPAQMVNSPDLPPGAEMKLEKMTGSGSGSINARLDGLIPTSTMETSSSMTMVVSMSGQTQPMEMDSKIKLSIVPGGKK